MRLFRACDCYSSYCIHNPPPMTTRKELKKFAEMNGYKWRWYLTTSKIRKDLIKILRRY